MRRDGASVSCVGPIQLHLKGVAVMHRGVARGATDPCLIEVLKKALATTVAGTAIAAGGSIQVRISNDSTNDCTTLDGAILLRVRMG